MSIEETFALIKKHSWRVGYVIVAVPLHLFADSLHLPSWAWLVTLTLIIVVGEATPASASFVARTYSTRRTVTFVVTLTAATLGIAFLIFAQGPSRPISYQEVVSFALSGLLVGVVFRVLLTAYFQRTLRDAPAEAQKFLLLLIVAIFVGLFPTSNDHVHLGGVFLLGIAAGFFLHYRVRGKEHQRAGQSRLLKNVLNVAVSSGEAFSFDVQDALKAFSSQQWRRLDRIINKTTRVSTELCLLNASRHRILGSYDRALDVLGKELARADRQPRLDGLLHLQMALNYHEKNDVVQMNRSLKSAEDCDPQSVLTNITVALRAAEQIELETAAGDHEGTDEQKSALRRVWKALECHQRQRADELWSTATGTTVPATWTFLLDSYAYVLLKTGRHRFAKSLLEQCIYEDPTFASPYLHLGEWYLVAAKRAHSDDSRGFSWTRRELHHLAEISFRIAISLEQGRESALKRRAEMLLKPLLN